MNNNTVVVTENILLRIIRVRVPHPALLFFTFFRYDRFLGEVR